MKCLASFQELDALGEGLVRDYTNKTRRWNAICLDIEGFIKDYLGLSVVYEKFAEEDRSKIGYLANGVDPLLVYRGGVIAEVIFPKNTIVIDEYLLKEKESSRRRFTLAHEAAHMILEKHIPMQAQPCFHSDFQGENPYSREDLKRIFSLNETCANRLGAAILMPAFLVAKAMSKYFKNERIICYDGVFSQKMKLALQRMADALGVSYSALVNRLRELNLMDYRPMDEYIANGLGFGGELPCQ